MPIDDQYLYNHIQENLGAHRQLMKEWESVYGRYRMRLGGNSVRACRKGFDALKRVEADMEKALEELRKKIDSERADRRLGGR